jgi:hypothetical protein
MPSKKQPKLAPSTKAAVKVHPLFWPLVVVAFGLWLVYRTQIIMPVWFDEIIAKAIFFGLPVWLYMNLGGGDEVYDSIRPENLEKGLLLGLAIGGMYGFAGALAATVVGGGAVYSAPLFADSKFWWEFFLVFMTAFWETLFFYSWIMAGIQKMYRSWGILPQAVLAGSVFLLFHLPNTILRYDTLPQIMTQVLLLSVFGLGQALVFSRWRNFYTLVVSHAFWAMVLFVHLS